MISRRLIGVSGCAFTLSLAATSFAGPAVTARRIDVAAQFRDVSHDNKGVARDYGRVVSLYAGGNNNNQTQGAVPGMEHLTVSTANISGQTILTVLAIRGRIPETEKERGDYRSICSSYELTKTGLKALATGVSIGEHLDGDKARTFNRPIMVSTPHGYSIALYASENDTNRPSTWAVAIDQKTCKPISNILRVSHNIMYGPDADPKTTDDPNLKEGNHDATFTGDYNEGPGGNASYNGVNKAGHGIIQFGITRGHNDENVGYVRNLHMAEGPNGRVELSVGNDWEWTMFGNLTRQFVIPIADGPGFVTQTLVCGNAASNRNTNERPGRAGVPCFSMKSAEDGSSLQVVSKFTVSPTYKEAGVDYFPNQVSGGLVKVDAKAGFAYFALNTVDSNGAGRNTNTQGSNRARATLAKVALFSHDSNGTISMIASVSGTDVAKHSKHSFGVATSSYGPNGQPGFAVFAGSPTGVTPAALHVTPIKADMSGFDPWDQKEWTTGIADSGYLSNKFGQNPGNQGRDFDRVYETVENPGFGQADGFMNMAKTLWIVSYAGQDKQSAKNRGAIALIPASWDASVDPHPINATSADLPPVTPVPPAPVVAPTPAADSGGCACSTPGGSTSTSNTLGSLALFGLVLGGMLRRRKA